jgi:hypothetical protein
MSKKTSWVEVDKRIRNRRHDWTAEELRELEQGEQKLPDSADAFEVVVAAQPAVGSRGRGEPN